MKSCATGVNVRFFNVMIPTTPPFAARLIGRTSGLIAASGGAVVAEEQTSRVSPTKGRPVAFIESRDGVGLFYRDWGSGSPLVFLAPWGMDSDWWEYQMAYLVGQGLRCIAYDRRGHGRSVEPSGGYEFDTLADDLNDVIERLDLHSVTLVGHSMGAWRWSVICRGMVLAASLGSLWFLPIHL